MKNVLKLLAKAILTKSRLTAVAVAAETKIYKKLLGWDNNTNNFKKRNGWYHENS